MVNVLCKEDGVARGELDGAADALERCHGLHHNNFLGEELVAGTETTECNADHSLKKPLKCPKHFEVDDTGTAHIGDNQGASAHEIPVGGKLVGKAHTLGELARCQHHGG